MSLLRTGLLLWLGCGQAPDAPAPAEPVAAATPEDRALAEADRIVAESRDRLTTRMIQELRRHPPTDDVAGGSIEADALTEAVPDGAAAPAGQTSLRLRNPANTAPAWVTAWLEAQGDREASGVTGIRQVEDTDAGRVARVLTPIPLEPRCLTCHGPEDTLPVDVRTDLSRRFPDDRATGYQVGDLRGALWAEVPVR
ncbi:MAG: DUF3365 domain-containing protein [Myxococcota bacterium]